MIVWNGEISPPIYCWKGSGVGPMSDEMETYSSFSILRTRFDPSSLQSVYYHDYTDVNLSRDQF